MEYEVLNKEEEERRIKEFKSLYYELNAKPDSTTKLYNDKVIVTKDDIERLDDLIREKMSFHVNEREFGISNVIVSTSKHKTYSFNDFKLFANHGWKNVAEYVSNITLSWDFFVKVEGYKRPQRHKLTVKITDGLKIEEALGLMFSGRIEDIQEIEEQQATIIAQMDFIESRLGQEFINIVGEWVDTLARAYTDKNKFVLFLKKHRKMVAYYFNYALSVIMSLLSLVGFNFYIGNLGMERMMDLELEHMQFITNYVVVSIMICFFIVNIGETVANKIFRILSEYGENFVFRITKGDENKYNKIAVEDRNGATKVLTSFIFSLILNIGCGIIASILYSGL